VDLSHCRGLLDLQPQLCELHCRNNLQSVQEVLVDCVNSSGSTSTRLAFQWERLTRLDLANNVLDGFHDSLVRASCARPGPACGSRTDAAWRPTPSVAVVAAAPKKLAPHLEDMDFAHNAIERIQDLEFLTNLSKLNLSFNRICTVENVVSALGNIRELYLRGNNLESFQGASSAARAAPGFHRS